MMLAIIWGFQALVMFFLIWVKQEEILSKARNNGSPVWLVSLLATLAVLFAPITISLAMASVLYDEFK